MVVSNAATTVLPKILVALMMFGAIMSLLFYVFIYLPKNDAMATDVAADAPALVRPEPSPTNDVAVTTPVTFMPSTVIVVADPTTVVVKVAATPTRLLIVRSPLVPSLL